MRILDIEPLVSNPTIKPNRKSNQLVPIWSDSILYIEKNYKKKCETISEIEN